MAKINSPDTSSYSKRNNDAMRAIAYSLDSLIPAIYLWLGIVKIRIGGSLPEENYPGTIHSPIGAAIVLPGYKIYSTYQGNYDPR